MDINPVVAALSGVQFPASILIKAKVLSRSPLLRHMSEEDIRQHLLAGVLAKAEQYDHQRAGVETFIDRVAITEAMMLLRTHRTAKRRGDRHTASLDAIAEAIGSGGPKSEVEQMLNLGSVREACESVRHDLAPLLESLRQGKSPSAVAREQGIDPRRINASLKQLRAHFEKYVDPT